jgi:hypothetical protein
VRRVAGDQALFSVNEAMCDVTIENQVAASS